MEKMGSRREREMRKGKGKEMKREARAMDGNGRRNGKGMEEEKQEVGR